MLCHCIHVYTEESGEKCSQSYKLCIVVCIANTGRFWSFIAVLIENLCFLPHEASDLMVSQLDQIEMYFLKFRMKVSN